MSDEVLSPLRGHVDFTVRVPTLVKSTLPKLSLLQKQSSPCSMHCVDHCADTPQALSGNLFFFAETRCINCIIVISDSIVTPGAFQLRTEITSMKLFSVMLLL